MQTTMAAPLRAAPFSSPPRGSLGPRVRTGLSKTTGRIEPSAPPGALEGSSPDPPTWTEVGRRLGHDLYCRSLLPLQPDWPLPLREGFLQASAAHRCRRPAMDRWLRKWLQLRLGAWIRGHDFDPALDCDALRQLDTEVCPVTLERLTHATRRETDASVDRLDNSRGYTLHNLAVMSLRANRAKADMSLQEVLQRAGDGIASRGLSPAQWKRLGALMLRACRAAPTLTCGPTVDAAGCDGVAAVLSGGEPGRVHVPRAGRTGGLRSRTLAVAAACAAVSAPAWAQDMSTATSQAGERIEVTGARQSKVDTSISSESLPAAVQVLDAERIERLNVRSYSDLFLTVPGVQSKNFGQGEIGAPFVMRGFGGGGSHGVATAVFIDGVPQNIPSGGVGGNGTSEYNWLTPEMIERVEVIKGPFSALYGDQALAGVVNIVTKTCARSAIGFETASYGLARVAGAACRTPTNDDGAIFFGAFEAYHSDGYRARSKYDRFSLLGKATLVIGGSEVALRANVYRAVYQAPGYLNFDQIRAGLLDPRSSLFASDGGDNTRFAAVATVKPGSGESGWYGTLYVDRFERARFSSFNAAMPMLQNEAIDERTVFGGRLHRHWLYGDRGALTVGADTRNDRGDIGSFPTMARERTGAVNSDYGLDIRSAGVFVQAQLKVSDPLKLVGGYRFDRFEQAIDNRLRPARSGSGQQSVGSPRVGLVYRIGPVLSVFANAGQGFRSLGATEVSPAAAMDSPDFGLRIPRGSTRDIGFNARWNGLQINANIYRTEIRNELRQEPPGSGILVNIGDSERNGYEIDARWRAAKGLALFGSYAHLDARVRNPINPAQSKLQNASPNLLTLGLELTRPTSGGRLLLDLYAQHNDRETFYIGNVERETDPYQIFNLRATFEKGRSSYSAYAILEPKKFGSDQAGNAFNPKPRRQLGLAYKRAG